MIRRSRALSILPLALLASLPALAQAEDLFTEVGSDVGLADARPFRLAAADVNGDDYPDLLLIGRDGRMQLFLNRERPGATVASDRQFVDFTAESGIGDARELTSLAALADVDNDGDADLIVGVYYHRIENFVDTGDRNEVLLNDGDGHFSVRADNGLNEAGLINTSGASFLDFDRDGNVDLYLGTWWEDYTNEVPGHGRLYRGGGDGSFTDVTSGSGLDTVLAPLYGTNVADYNGDGNADIVASVYCRSGSQLWHNRGDGTFAEVGSENGFANGNNCTWAAMPADYDNDSDIDFLQVVVHGYEGPGQIRSAPVVNQGAAGDFGFDWRIDWMNRDQPTPNHHGDHYATWLDMDNDGRLDLALTESSYDPALDRLYLFQHGDDHRLEDVTAALGLMGILQPHAAAAVDYDLDGDDDLLVGLIATAEDELLVLRNDIPAPLGHHFIGVRLEPPQGVNGSAIGARVTVTSGDLVQTREVYAGEGNFSGQTPFILNFGLGTRDTVDSITVRWPDADLSESVAHPDAVDQIVTLPAEDGQDTEGSSEDSGDAGDSGDSADTSAGETEAADGEAGGCACRTQPGVPVALWALLGLVGWRRRTA